MYPQSLVDAPRSNRRAISNSLQRHQHKREGNMNFLQTAYAAVLIGLSSNAYAAVNGINYDPAHTDAWKNAQQSNQFETLKSIFSSDLDQIKNGI
jgi:hypothetical protein